MARGKKKQAELPDEPKKKTMYTHKLSQEQLDKLQHALEMRSWEGYEVEYAQFAFRGNRVNVVGYKSGKLVVQGKDTEDFVINVLEPEILGEARFGYDEVYHPEWFESHAGMDESGKGDLFGPVVTACVVADKPHIDEWIKAGIRDSKTITDGRILKLDKLITGVTLFTNEEWRPYVMLACVYLLTNILTEALSNNAAAVLMATLAIGIAETLGVELRPFIFAVAIAASASFSTPIGYQTNTYVYGAGGYRFFDFLKIGGPLNLICFSVTIVIIPLVWSF